MSSGDKKVNIYLKKFLTQQQITENFLEYLQKLIFDAFAQTWQASGVFDPDILVQELLSSDTVDTFDIFTPLIGTDGPTGHILNLDAADANNIAFENTVATPYFVGLRFQEIPVETEINVRTSEIKYTLFEEAIGELADPDVVVDDLDETLTITVDSIFEAGVSHAGRKVRVWLKEAVSQADTFEDVTVIFSGGFNKIETTTAIGQTLGNISTDPADYQVFAIGSTVRRNTDLRLDPDIMFVGIVTGAGAGNSPSSFDETDVNNLSFGLSGLTVLFDVEHILADGTHQDITAETITTKQAIQGIQLDTRVNAGDEDSPDAPITHTLFSSTGGSGIQDAKWVLRESGGTVIAFVDAHGNAYFQNLAAVDSVFKSNLSVEGNTILGNDIGNDIVTFNSVQQSLSDLIYIIDSNDDGTNSYKFYNHSIMAANLLMELLDVGDLIVKRDVLTGSGSVYSKNSDLSAILVDASLNEVYDQTKARDLLRLTPNNPADTQLLISASNINLASGEIFGLVQDNLEIDYAGGSVDFATGIITGGGSNFTPFTPSGVSRFFKYGIVLTSINEIAVIAPTADFATKNAALADKTLPILAGGLPIGIIVVEDNGAGGSGTIENIDEDDIIRFGAAGAGGAGSIVDVQTEFNILNFQSVAQDLTGLIIDKTITKAAIIFFDIFRRTDTQSVTEIGHIKLVFDSETNLWRQPIISESDFDDGGVIFSVDTTTGQLKYKSGDLTGASYSGVLRVRDITEIPITSPDDKIINNDQSVALNLSGLLFDKTITKAVIFFFDISRRTDTQSVIEVGHVKLVFDTETSAWRQPIISESDFEDAGVIFSVDTGTGQLKYKSSDLTGANYSGVLKITDTIKMEL